MQGITVFLGNFCFLKEIILPLGPLGLLPSLTYDTPVTATPLPHEPLMIHDICLGIYFYRMLLGVGPYQLGAEPRPLGEANFDECFAWGLAWGGFAWGCEAGVY